MNLAARLKTLKAVQARLARLEYLTLVSLPREYGFRSMDAFIAAIRHATRLPRQSTRRKNWVRPGGTQQLRRDVAELLAQRKTAVEVALKLGLSMRVVDRAMTVIESGKTRRRSPKPKRKHRAKAATHCNR